MRSNYSRLGDYIREVNVRNRGLEVTTLVGLSISKEFIPSVANTIGTDMSTYKIIKHRQFACSLMQVSRDGKIPIAMLELDEAIMSPAYPIFEVADTDMLLPEYLMMWFSRSEFDREASYYAVGGVRGSLTWEDFCNMQLPIPSIEKQRSIVKEYQTLTDRINLNETLCDKLEQTAQALYRKMFIDNIDPENLPHGWRMGTIGELCDIKYGKDHSLLKNGDIPVYGSGGIMRFADTKLYDKTSVLIPRKGSLNNILYINTPFWTVDTMFYTTFADVCFAPYLYYTIKGIDFLSLDTGSAVPSMTTKVLNQMQIVVPKIDLCIEFENKITTFMEHKALLVKETDSLVNLQKVLLSKISTNII